MILRSFTLALLGATFIATASQAQTARTVTEEWNDTSLFWVGGQIFYEARWMVFEEDELLVVCCVGRNMSAQGTKVKRVLRGAGLFVGDELAMQDMTFFNRIKKRDDFVGSTAHCKATGRKLSEFSSTSISLGKALPGRKY